MEENVITYLTILARLRKGIEAFARVGGPLLFANGAICTRVTGTGRAASEGNARSARKTMRPSETSRETDGSGNSRHKSIQRPTLTLFHFVLSSSFSSSSLNLSYLLMQYSEVRQYFPTTTEKLHI